MRLLLLVSAACFLGACKDDSPETSALGSWLVAEADLGAPRASGTGLTLGDGSGLWSPLAQVVPWLEYEDPASDVPFTAWDLVTSTRVADMGSCPDVQAVGRTTTWETWDCRSSQGYEWSGQVSQEEWDDDATGWRYARWDFDLDVVADVDEPRFDALSLAGSVLYVIGDGETLHHAVQINATTHLVGYWARQNATDPREALWDDWVSTARYEQDGAGRFQFEGKADLGGQGGLRFSSADLSRGTACTTVPIGTVTLQADRAATLVFAGDAGCSHCADLRIDGEDAGTTCKF